MVSISFKDLGLGNWIVEHLKVVGVKNPTLIQEKCIKPILEGSDVIACAKTGSGKTAAYALPILQKFCEESYAIYAVILSPTRELAFQVGEQIKLLSRPLNMKVCVITGGRDMMEQGLQLSDKPHVVVATPGRLADHIRSGTNFSLRKIRFLVLDEADRLLEDAFGSQLSEIFACLPRRRQTLLFSATLTDTLERLRSLSEKEPFVFVDDAPVATVVGLEQGYVLRQAAIKDAYLVHIVDDFCVKNSNSSVMVFVQTCKICAIVSIVLNELGLSCVALHSLIPQRERLEALQTFKASRARILIATDVASRGLDIPTVDMVINHNVPRRPKDYVHRVGRTARAGRCGRAITLVSEFDINLLRAVEKQIGTDLPEVEVNDEEVSKIFAEVAVTKRQAEIRLDEANFGEAREVNKRKNAILDGKDPDEVKKVHPKKARKRSKTGKISQESAT